MISEAIDAHRVDSIARRMCTFSGQPLVAAVDSSIDELRAADREHAWDDQFDEHLPQGDAYMAVCVVRAADIPALADDLEFFAVWQSDGYGSAVLGGW